MLLVGPVAAVIDDVQQREGLRPIVPRTLEPENDLIRSPGGQIQCIRAVPPARHTGARAAQPGGAVQRGRVGHGRPTVLLVQQILPFPHPVVRELDGDGIGAGDRHRHAHRVAPRRHGGGAAGRRVIHPDADLRLDARGVGARPHLQDVRALRQCQRVHLPGVGVPCPRVDWLAVDIEDHVPRGEIRLCRYGHYSAQMGAVCR